MENFTPISATLGGVLIGVSAVLLMFTLGKRAGITGIVSGAVLAQTGDKYWRVAFVVGLVIAPLIYALAQPNSPIPFEINASWPIIVLGGLCVGFGTRLGGGCTSGHGVCGLSSFSPRSLVAVAAFMAAGIATVTIGRHIIGGI